VANEFARVLRKNPTDAERRLWFLLRYKKLGGYRFRRQQSIGPYVADFFCASAKLIVELDGDQHGTVEMIEKDRKRTVWLQEHGYRVLRFPNHEVFKTPSVVTETIWRALDAPPTRTARAVRPPPQGGGQSDAGPAPVRLLEEPSDLKAGIMLEFGKKTRIHRPASRAGA
jgi:very-short-patch-repair endonuclease